MKFEIWNLKPETWNLKPETWNLKPETWDLRPEIWHLKPEIWHLKSGIWNPKSGIPIMHYEIRIMNFWNLKSAIWSLKIEIPTNGIKKILVRVTLVSADPFGVSRRVVSFFVLLLPLLLSSPRAGPWSVLSTRPPVGFPCGAPKKLTWKRQHIFHQKWLPPGLPTSVQNHYKTGRLRLGSCLDNALRWLSQ